MPIDLKRALTDKAYVESLTPEERKELLEKAKELGDDELDRIGGGKRADSGTKCTTITGNSVTMCLTSVAC